VLQMPRYLLHLPIALILSSLAGFTAAQQDEVSIPSSLLVSASSGDAEAQYLLGQSLDQGQLFGAEIREAFNWYKQSADQGYALAETVVGQMYVEGRGVPQNFSEGEEYLLRAASKGLSAAQLVLGGIKLESEEFPQAYLLFSLAMTLAEDEETYNEATAGRSAAETNLQEAEITVLQSRATTCIESEFEQCDFGPLSLEDLSFLDVVEPEVEPEAGEEEEIETPLNIRVVENTPADDRATADEPRVFQPAVFGEFKDEFLSRINLPRTDKDYSLTVLCSGILRETGTFELGLPAACFLKNEITETNQTSSMAESFVKVVSRATRRMKANPAIVNGEAKPVWFNFHVTIEKSGNQTNKSVIENHLYNTANLGETYISAQRYLRGKERRRDFPDECRVNNVGGGMFAFNVASVVDRSGEMTQFRVLEGQADEKCLDSIESYLENSSFVPAHLSNRPVDSIFVEFYTFGSAFGIMGERTATSF